MSTNRFVLCAAAAVLALSASVTASDSVLKIATVWNQSEFNIVGDGNGSQANPVFCVKDSRRCRHRRNERASFEVGYAES